jgi:hypothetical protein
VTLTANEPVRQHNHHQPGPVVIVHSPLGGEGKLGDPENPAHAFGPFASEEEALAFDRLAPDNCYKVILDLFEPDA